MRVLLDTNVALRVFDAGSTDYGRLNAAIARLRAAGCIPTVAPQVLYEAYVVLTRGPNENGWGLSPDEAVKALAAYSSACELLPDPAGLTQEWLTVCADHEVRGKQAHDARLVAFMRLHGIAELATLNPGDFSRYTEIQTVKM